jgi:UDP-3-O-[3-hydroxymyristoyl] N-acetylglucosamine deacetylase / 3-hydroxyacyl-[acyl-carrier-protein] dehydratase
MNQQSIRASVSLQGIGLHTGASVTLTIHPATENFGIKFQRLDLPNQPIVLADVAKVVSTNRSTVLQQGEARVHTVEHLLSALVALGIDNALITIDAEEIPILDGSSQPFVDLIQSIGIVEQNAAKEYFEVQTPIHYIHEPTGAEFLALPTNHFAITCIIDFNTPFVGQQIVTFDTLANYATEIAPARTFVMLSELEQLAAQGLIKGGNVDNAIVIVDKLLEQTELDTLAEKIGRKTIKIEQTGVLNNTQLRFSNEAVRHKALDVIGDLALIGKMTIKGKIIATKSGHAANIAFVKVLKEAYLAQKKLQGVPKYDPSIAPIYDVVEIAKRLPHRYPFLLVDKIIELSENHVVGVKNITFNEGFFQGHFPNNPVMPGVLQIEAMAQCGGILALSTVPDPHNWDTYFLKIDDTKFKQKVVPGDTVVFKMELLEPIRRGIVHMRGTAFVANKLVSEGDLTAQIVRRKVD